MARITIEDTRSKIGNKFELVVLTAQRVRELISGAKATISSKNKEVVVALREIAEGRVSPQLLKEALVVRHQSKRQVEQDDPYQNNGDHFSSEEAWKAFNETAAGTEQGANAEAHDGSGLTVGEAGESDESDNTEDFEDMEEEQDSESGEADEQMFKDEEDLD